MIWLIISFYPQFQMSARLPIQNCGQKYEEKSYHLESDILKSMPHT
jgi:hypothetical protein